MLGKQPKQNMKQMRKCHLKHQAKDEFASYHYFIIPYTREAHRSCKKRLFLNKKLCIVPNVIRLALSFISCLCAFVMGCAADRAAMDLVEYVNQDILDIAQLEQKALESYASVTGKNFTTDKMVYEVLKNDVIPHYGQFVDLLNDIDPKTREIKELHGIYITGAEYLYNGFKAKMAGIGKKDTYLIREANRQIDKGRVETEKWRMKLMDLCKKYRVTDKVEN